MRSLGIAGAVCAVGWLLVLRLGFAAAPPPAPTAAPPPATLASVCQTLAALHVFVANDGQWPEAVRFAAHRGPLSLHACDGAFGVVLARHEPAGRPAGEEPPRAALDEARRLPHRADVAAAALRFSFEGARPVRPVGHDRVPTRFHYLRGRDPARWRSDVPGYERLCYPQLWQGVDLVLHGGARGDFEYDLRLAPGADLERVAIRVAGASAPLSIDGGDLLVQTPIGPLRQPRPQAFASTAAGERPVACSYEILGPDRVGFRVEGLDRGAALLIDPQLQYSTYFGGTAWDEVFAMVADADSVVLAGRTFAADFPTRNALQANLAGGADAFVLRLPLTGGAPAYATYLGGTLDDEARAVALDAAGGAVIAGATYSPDFPVRHAFQSTHAGRFDAYVAVLSPSGASLLYSTYLGGSGVEGVVGLALDATGAAVVTGGTSSLDFPVRNAFQAGNAGGFDAFIARVPLTGVPPTSSSYLGGAADDGAVAVALDANGDAVVAGWTNSGDFPTRNAFQSQLGGAADAFVSCLPLSGGPPSCSTFLGGSAGDIAYALALDANGAAVVAGGTSSPDFPTRNAAQSALAGASDAFVTRLPLTGAPPVASTYLGGGVTETALGVALDASGAAIVTGWTFSPDFPTVDPWQSTLAGGADVFLTRLPAAGSAPTYSTFLGGATLDKSYAVAVDDLQRAIVVGLTDSVAFPTANPFQATLAGYFDVFVTRLDLLPRGASTFGASTPGCAGLLPTLATGSPQVGNGAFAVGCARAPAAVSGVFGLSSAALPAPIVVLGAELWIDPAAPVFATAIVGSAADGTARVPLPIPPDPGLAGAQVCVQWFWPDACAIGRTSATNALRVVVQP
ncbi:MAG: hypothetical protein R3F56_09845 [Planctomycetota bacterium]